MHSAAIAVKARTLPGERRQVTAFFYDIVGSTQLLQRYDMEDYRALQRVVHREVEAIVHAGGGYIAPPQGDGGYAFFGIPDALETSSEDAVHSAVAVLERLAALRNRNAELPSLRIGIATGWSVVTPEGVVGGAPFYDVVGLAPTLAARVQGEAAPNTAVVSELTYELTEGLFAYGPLGARPLKGFAKEMRLWTLLGSRPGASRFGALRGAGAPLVGREAELALCAAAVSEVVAGGGRALFFFGEAGIGKSRLVAELQKPFSGERHAIVLLQCQPQGRLRPLHPFVDLLRREMGDAGGGDRADVAERCRSLGVCERDAAAVASLVGGSEAEDRNAMSPQGFSAAHRDEAIAAAATFVLALLRPGPGLLVVEDLHWTDSLTLGLIAELVAATAAMPILLAVTSRDPAPAEVADHVHAVALERLSEAAVAEMVDAILGWHLADDAASFIHSKSDGIPLFAEELALRLRDQLAEPAGRAPADLGAALEEGGIRTLHDLLGGRLSALGEHRRIAQIASVVGRDVSEGLLERLLDAYHEPPLGPTLVEAIERLKRHRIFERGRGASGSAFRFSHVLLQEVAYGSLLKAERREIHASIARLAAADPTLEMDDGTIAWHFAKARNPLEAARFAIRAAAACFGRSAVAEADQLLVLARQQLDACDEADPETENVRLRFLMTRGPVNAALFGRGAAETRRVYDEGVAICRRRGEAERATWFPLYWGWWFTSTDYEALRDRAKVLVSDVGGGAIDQEVRLQSLHCAWATHFDGGHHAYCLECVDQGLALYDEERAARSTAIYGGHDAKVCALGERALSLWFTGNEAAAEASIAAARDWARHLDHLDSTLHALTYTVGFHRYRNDFAGVARVAGELEALAQQPFGPGTIAKARLFRGWARAMAGDGVAGAAEFDDGYERQRAIGTIENASMYVAMRAEILERLGDLDAALTLLDGNIAAANASGQTFWLAELYRTRARLRLRLGAREEMDADLASAVEVATAQGATTLLLRAMRDRREAGADRRSA